MSIAALTSGAGSSLRNNYSDYVGLKFTVGSNPLYVNSLGRWVVSGNSGTHTVKLVTAAGVDVVGGSVSISTSGKSVGYSYTALASTITLAASTTYILVSLEATGGDQWYDSFVVTSTADITGLFSEFHSGSSYSNGSSNQSYVPVNFLYDLTLAAPSSRRIGLEGGFRSMNGGFHG